MKSHATWCHSKSCMGDCGHSSAFTSDKIIELEKELTQERARREAAEKEVRRLMGEYSHYVNDLEQLVGKDAKKASDLRIDLRKTRNERDELKQKLEAAEKEVGCLQQNISERIEWHRQFTDNSEVLRTILRETQAHVEILREVVSDCLADENIADGHGYGALSPDTVKKAIAAVNAIPEKLQAIAMAEDEVIEAAKAIDQQLVKFGVVYAKDSASTTNNNAIAVLEKAKSQ